MSESPASISSTASSPHPDQVVTFLCQRYEDSDDPLPNICHQIFDSYRKKQDDALKHNAVKDSSHAIYSNKIPNTFLRLLSMFGIFGAAVMVLTLLVYFTCVRQKKCVEEYQESSDSTLPNTEVLSLPQQNVHTIQPPDYADVVRREEEELPSYSEAVKSDGCEN